MSDIVVQPLMKIPQKYLAGLATGKYKRNGGVIRNKKGQIVTFLEEVADNKNSTNLAKVVKSRKMFKKSWITLGVVVGVSTVATGVYLAYSKIKEKKQNIDKEEMITIGFNKSLTNYINAIKKGDLSLEILEDFIWNVNFIKENSENKEIKIENSINQLEELLNLIYKYTIELAKINNINTELIRDNKENYKNNSFSIIIYCLNYQKEIFEGKIAN
ncbi:MAG: hypothetical protein ACLUD1_03300 [Clostridia bacterium]